MSEPFDAYLKWLGIQPKDRPSGDQPPNHYRLLALELFEVDSDAISNAADRQMAHVRTFQTGQHSALSQKLLNELSAARVCLLNREKKGEYDAALKRELTARAPAVPTHDPDGISSASQRQAVAAGPAVAIQTAQPPTARRPLPKATSLPTPVIQSAPVMGDAHASETAGAPYVTHAARHTRRRRNAGWRIPAVVVATLALLAGAAYVVVELNRTVDDEPVPKQDPRVVAQQEPDKSKERKSPVTQKKIKDDPNKPATIQPDKKDGDKTKPENTKADITNADPIGKSTASFEKPRAVESGPIDLLKLIDPKRNAVHGDWRLEEGELVAPAIQHGRVQIPLKLPEEYELTCVVTGADLSIGLVVAGRQVMLALDGWGESNTSSGLQMVDGRRGNENVTTHRGRVLAKDSPTTVRCTVRKRSVDVTCNGQPIIAWSGDPSSFTLDGPLWVVPNADQLFLYCWTVPYRISKLELTPLVPATSAAAVASSPSQEAVGKPPTVNPQVPLGNPLTEANKRSPVPPEDTLSVARREAEEKFADDLQAAKTPDRRLNAARKIQRAALAAKVGGAERYVLLDQARDLAAVAGSSKVAFEAIDELAKGYEIDELGLRLKTLEEATKASSTPAAKKEHVDSARELIESCVAADRFAEATRAATLGQAAARVLKDPSLTKEIADEKKEADRLGKAYAAIKDDLARLVADANDPAANLAVGKFYCLTKEDWRYGLPHLAASGDAAFKELAQRELARPNGPDDEKAVGDAWWELSRKEKGSTKAALASRAAFWYRRVVTLLGGVEREAIEQRLREIGGPAGKTQFLTELPELDLKVNRNWFGKGRNSAENRPISVNGKESPHALFTVPPTNGFASVSYELGRKARRLNFAIAIDDAAGYGERTPLVFEVFGDGQRLWSSAPIVDKGMSVSCELKVSNITMLELRVNCPGRDAWAYPVWLEPRVTWR